MGDWRLILLLSVTIALYINILTKFNLTTTFEEKVEFIFESLFVRFDADVINVRHSSAFC